MRKSMNAKQSTRSPASASAVLDNCPQGGARRSCTAGHRRFLTGESLPSHSSRERCSKVESGQHPTAACWGLRPIPGLRFELLFDTGFGDLVSWSARPATFHTAAIASGYAVPTGRAGIVVLGHERCGAVEGGPEPRR